MSVDIAHFRYPGVVFAYCLCNLLFFATVQSYGTLGGELLDNGDFVRGFAGWNLQGAAAGVTLEGGALSITHPTTASTTIAQCWPAAELPRPLLLSAEGRSQGVQPGIESWHQARIDLVGYDAGDKGLYKIRTRLLSLQGDHPWQTAQALFQVPLEAQRICVEISLYHASGRFQARHLTLSQGAETLRHKIGRRLLLAGWLGLSLWLLPPLYRLYRQRRLGRGVLLIASLILIGVLLPHEMRQQLEAGALHILSGIGLSMASSEVAGATGGWALLPAQWDLSKFSHLLGFALLASLFGADREIAPGRRLVLLLALAVATETLQFFVPMRTPRLSDLVVDGIGIGLGLGLTALWLHNRASP